MPIRVAEVEAVLKARDEMSAVLQKNSTVIKGFQQDIAKTQQSLGSLNTAQTEFASATGASTSVILKYAAGFVTAQAAISVARGVLGGYINLLKESVSAYAEAQQGQVKLTAALVAQGTATREVTRQYQQLASSFERTTTFSDDLITEMQALLIQVGTVLPQDMERALKASTDLAAGLGIDLRTATLLVGKAFAGETGTLARYGIVIDDVALKARGADAVLDAINQKFGGQVQAQAQTYTGQLEQMANAWNNVKEAVGRLIVEDPALQLSLRTGTRLLQELSGANTETASTYDTVKAASQRFGDWLTFGMTKQGREATEGIYAMVTALEDLNRMFDQVAGKSPYKAIIAATDKGDIRNQLAQNMTNLGGIDYVSQELAKSAQDSITKAIQAQKEAADKAKEAAEKAKRAWAELVDLVEGPATNRLRPFGIDEIFPTLGKGPTSGLSPEGLLIGNRLPPLGQPFGGFQSTAGAGRGPSFLGSLFGGFGTSGFGQMMGGNILQAITGGGSITGAIGGTAGGHLFSNLAGNLTEGLKGTLGKVLGGSLNAILPGVGTLLGSLAGKLFGGLFGGEGRKTNKMREEFLQSVGGLEELQKMAESVNFSLEKMLSTKKTKDFQAEVAKLNTLLEAEKQRAEEVLQTFSDLAQSGSLASQAQLKTITKVNLKKPDEKAATEQFLTQNVQRVLDGLTKVAENATITSQKAATAISNSAVLAFKQLQDMGLSTVEILKEMGPALTDLSTKLKDAGLKGAAGFGTLSRMAQLLAKDDIAKLVETADGLNSILIGLANTALLDQETFLGLGQQASDTFNQLIKQGVSGNDALLLMAPTLQTLWELEQDRGFKVDETTQKLIDQAVQQGIVGDSFRSESERMMKALEELIGRVGELVDAILGVGDGAGEAADGIDGLRKDANKDLDDIAKHARKAADAVAAIGHGGPNRPGTGGGGGGAGDDGPPGNVHHGGQILHAGGFARLDFLAGKNLAGNEVPAILERGEFVVRKESVQKIGNRFLQQLNRMHDGGPVVPKAGTPGSVGPMMIDPGGRALPDPRDTARNLPIPKAWGWFLDQMLRLLPLIESDRAVALKWAMKHAEGGYDKAELATATAWLAERSISEGQAKGAAQQVIVNIKIDAIDQGGVARVAPQIGEAVRQAIKHGGRTQTAWQEALKIKAS